MWRALLLLALALGIVLGGLLLLRRTANMPPPRVPREPQPRDDDQDEDKDKDEEDDDRGW
jgi:uncharacterized membrane protein affecting hemolysin expression